MARVLVGLLWHEGNSFNPLETLEADFSLSVGEALLRDYRGSETALGGILRALERQGFDPLPATAARARPGGPVERAFIVRYVDSLAEAVRRERPDAICLDLHGATTATGLPDVEGHLLTRLRQEAGPDTPIAVAADLHGYITPAMTAAADIITGYRTNPHADMGDTGERAVRLLARLLDGERPKLTSLRVPMLAPGNDWTSKGPLADICATADAMRADPRITDLSVFNTQPQLDVADTGQTVLVYSQDKNLAAHCARELCAMLWRHRTEFTTVLADLNTTLAGKKPGLLALGDFGDRVLGGAPGDSLYVAETTRRDFPHLRTLSFVHDPRAVDRAVQVGLGNTAKFAIGAAVSSHAFPAIRPVAAHWTVKALGRAQYVNRGPYMAGMKSDFGEHAVLTDRNMTVVATTRAPNAHDPAAIGLASLDLDEIDVVVLKSGMHFHLSFSAICPCVSVATPGFATDRLDTLPYESARPVYPLDDIEWSSEAP